MKKVVALVLSLMLLLGLCSLAQAAVKIPSTVDETLSSSLDLDVQHPTVSIEQKDAQVIVTLSKNLDDFLWWGSTAIFETADGYGGTYEEPTPTGENQLVFNFPEDKDFNTFATFNFYHGLETADNSYDVNAAYDENGELIDYSLSTTIKDENQSYDLYVRYSADGKVLNERVYGVYHVQFYAGSGVLKTYMYWPEAYNGNMAVTCNPDGTVTYIDYNTEDGNYYWNQWDGWRGSDEYGNSIEIPADLPTAESLAGPELVAKVTVNQEDIEIPLTSAGAADLPLGVDEVPVISSTTLEDGKLTIVTSANIEDFNHYETDNFMTANIGYIYELNGETHYCWSNEAGEYDPETKTFTAELPEGAVLVSEPRIVINYQIDNMQYYYSINEDGVYASVSDDLVADFGQSFRYDADGNLVYIQNSIGLDYYMTIRYDENGALESYSYSLDENSRVSFLADGTLEMISYRTEEAYYLYTPEDGWHTRKWDAETESVIKTPAEAPEGAPNPDELEPLVVVAAKPAKPEPIWFGKNTLGLAAVSLKDLGISSDWHNVAPVDLTKDGTTVFTLVGADAWILGQAYVTVAEGNVTVDYAILDGHGYMKSEKLNWFLSKADLTEENLKADSNYAFGEPVSIADQLGGAEMAILFIDSKITFRQPYFDAYNYSTRYYRNRENWKEYREGLIEMIGE